MSDVAIKVEKLSKLYRLGMKEQIHDTLVGAVVSLLKSPWKNFKKLRNLSNVDLNEESDDILWALRDVSFDVMHGEVLGIIGRNGAGKSTLLKILSRIVEPTSGSVTINGRVASLLEVGTGFHPELTGRENVYMNGTILGMRKHEIDRKFDEIVAFSGVEKFIDTPIKRYSSGMKVRLAFSVAAHLEPEILIIDEVLAVGDAAFQKKCLGKMQEVATQGRTILFVSHQLESLSNLCTRAILLERGAVVCGGDTETVISEYISDVNVASCTSLATRNDRQGDGNMRFVETWVENVKGERTFVVRSGDSIKIILKYEVFGEHKINNLTVSLALNSNKNIAITLLRNSYTGDLFDNDIPEFGVFECVIPKLPLNSGTYYYNVSAHSSGGLEDWVERAGVFNVEAGDYFGTGKCPDIGRLIHMDHKWTISDANNSLEY